MTFERSITGEESLGAGFGNADEIIVFGNGLVNSIGPKVSGSACGSNELSIAIGGTSNPRGW